MPQTPEERRKTFEGLAARRQQMLTDEREKMAAREREAEIVTTRQKAASLEEQRKASQRGEAREEWRQEQHSKKEEMLADARRAAAERVRQEEKKLKEEAEDAERTKRMRALHDRAVTQKVAARKMQAEHIEQDTEKQVTDGLERDLRDVDRLLERTQEHLVQDRRKKIALLEDTSARQQKAMAERYAVRKKQAEADTSLRGGASVFQLTAEYKRGVMTLQGRTAEDRAKIESEYVRLKDEAVAQAEQKKARLRALADQRLREARTRHENADDWIESHRS
jgi:hypothetical protein